MGASGGVPGASRAPSGGVPGGSGGLLGGSREPLGEVLAEIREEVNIRSFLEASWRRLGAALGASWEPLGCILGSSWALLGPSWGHFGTSLALLGSSWRHLGNLKEQIAEKLKNATPPTQNPHFGVQDGAKMGPSWAKLDPSWGQVGPLSRLEAILESLWTKVVVIFRS